MHGGQQRQRQPEENKQDRRGDADLVGKRVTEENRCC